MIPRSFRTYGNIRTCLMEDPRFGDNPRLRRFLLDKKNIIEKPFLWYSNGKKLATLRGNCPLFKYWLSNEENCRKIQSMGYLSSSTDCSHPCDELISEFVLTFVRRHFRFRDAFVNSVNEVLAPLKSSLVMDCDKRFLWPFHKVKNLVSMHARFGMPMSDFKDYHQFLDENATFRFYSCAMRNNTENYVFVASDSSKAKHQLQKLLNGKYFEYSHLLLHSDRKYHLMNQTGKEISDATYNAFIDMIISAMASQFIGTEGSSYSAMIAMLGQMDTVYLYKDYKPCHKQELYFP